MIQDNINTELLLDIALNRGIDTGSEAEIVEVCDMYMENLDCFGLALFEGDHLRVVRPGTLRENPVVERNLQAIPAGSEARGALPTCFEADGAQYHVLSLSDYGCMVLLRKKPMTSDSLFQVNQVAMELGRDLTKSAARERHGFSLKLFDHASDTVQVYDETGRLVYTNLTSPARNEGGEKNISDHRTIDFEALFKDTLFENPDRWQAHLCALKEKGQLVWERVSANQATGEPVRVEITAGLAEADGKNYVVAKARDISLLKNQEYGMNRTAEKLESILNEMSEVVWSTGVPNYEMLFVSPSVEEMYEIPAYEWLADSSLWEKLIHPEDRYVIKLIYEGLEKKGRYDETYRIQTPSGKIKWVQNRGKYIYRTDGTPLRVDGIVKDITEQRLVREKEEYYIKMQEALIDIAVAFINAKTKDTHLVINDSLERMGLLVSVDRAYVFEYDFVNETVSNTQEWCREGIAPEIDNLQNVPIDLFPSWLERHKKKEALYIPDVSALDPVKEAGLRSILEPQGIKSLLAVPVTAGDELIGFVGFDAVASHREFSDSEQRLLFLFSQMLVNARNRFIRENRLRVQEEKYRNILTHMNLGLLEVDMDDNILYANESFCEMIGYAFSDIYGKRASDLLLNDHAKEVIAGKARERTAGVSSSYELEITTKAGEKKTWLVSGAPNFNDEGKLTGSIGVHMDISDQKLLERQLFEAKSIAEAAGESKERFLADMSHEIRTPLNIIIGMIRQLSKAKLTSEQQFFVGEAERSADHLLELVNDLLDMAKIESGATEIMHRPYNFDETIEGVAALMKNKAEEKGLDFLLRQDPGIRHDVVGDATRLRQILINLLGNAVKFTERGSVALTVKLLEESDNCQRLYFEVADTGFGMSKAYLSKVFSKFSQEQTRAHQWEQGSGLGMAIAQELVRLMGGELHVKSRKNKGTTFSFTLSLSSGKPAPIAQDNVTEANEFQNLKALVVEDNAMNRFIAVKSLEHLGIRSEEAQNGEAAVEILRKHRFDLILMDIQMPVMSGPDATRIIRHTLKLDTPIIALTANVFKSDIEHYLSQGMNAYIPKPYDEKVFSDTIRDTLAAARFAPAGQGPPTGVSPTPGPEEKPTYSLRLVKEMAHGKTSFTSDLITEFIAMAAQNCEDLQTALRKRDAETIREIAHRIKPSIDLLEIHALKSVVREVENHNRDTGCTEDLAVLVNRIIAVMGEVIADLKK